MPVLVDTSVWIDHLRHGEPALARLLVASEVLVHPWVTGELALGSLRDRSSVLDLLDQLPQAPLATAAEVRFTIEERSLVGTGIGFVDAQLVASTLLAAPALLWARNRRLARQAGRLGVEYVEPI